MALLDHLFFSLQVGHVNASCAAARLVASLSIRLFPKCTITLPVSSPRVCLDVVDAERGSGK